MSTRFNKPTRGLAPDAIRAIQAHRWPGNVRELENLIRRICALYGDDLITARIVERELLETPPQEEGADEPESLSQVVERKLAS